ncbi:helix-turn-helix protein [Thermosporothrix hazakensis]|jgi:transcriptional regulator with XRE-family HTH domain|uniref:Helix-turn-helix protein n=1 Tax=Thermosporothrix hazakensis TaxID=644383 RepID=A0A326UAZ8_THEHA|nr:helix-turn-helix transcriptional regulator [Thermosporothrix hazakensis]PZW32120.1 helix-turn-helix protein [Thermosporothrix hazakensis]GCE49552.1 hypothetical protein KTH_44210 [Thermosporothrix hazakensis]
MSRQQFSQQLRRERELRGWSQARLAAELGTTPNTVSAWERGISLPSPFFREKLCALLERNAQEMGLIQAEAKEEALQDISYTTIEIPSNEQKPIEQTIFSHKTAPTNVAPQIINRPLDIPEETRPPANKKARKLLLLTAILLILSLLIGAGSIYLTAQQPNPYTQKGTLVLEDTLAAQNLHLNWQEGWNENHASCQFRREAYFSYQPLEGFFHACIAQATNYQNFAYEVEMTLLSGDYGGLIFRSMNSIDSKYYLFRIHTDGRYALKLYIDKVDDHAPMLAEGTSAAIRTGIAQTNLLAVVADKETISLYANHQKLATIQNNTYTHGQIGLFAGNEMQAPAEGFFRNLKVWTW